MDRQTLVGHLVKYSALYVGDSNATEERNSYPFHVTLPQEQKIRERLSTAKVIILTGEAGDGKSRMLKQLREEAQTNGFTEIVDDFSQEPPESRKHIIDLLRNILSGNSPKKLLMAANIGLLVRSLLKDSPTQGSAVFFEELNQNPAVALISFESQNLAGDRDLFYNIITHFLSQESNGHKACSCEFQNCPFIKQCPFEKNLSAFLENDVVKENVRLLCNAIHLMGIHITFRELLSLLASFITIGYDCTQLRAQYASQPASCEDLAYYNLFEKKDGVVLSKLTPLDPAKKATKEDLALYEQAGKDLKCFSHKKRETFFQRSNNTYADLPVEYLQDFYNILSLLCGNHHAYDMTDANPALIKLKEGLVKLISPDQTDLEVSFFDIPLPVSGHIKTKFSINFNEISLIWRHPDWHPDTQESLLLTDDTALKSFCLSGYSVSGDKPDEYTLHIGYSFFAQILMAADEYYFPSSGNNLHKYGLFDFFRQILNVCPSYCEKVEILSDDKANYWDFDMSFYSQNKILSNSTAKRVLIRKR